MIGFFFAQSEYSLLDNAISIDKLVYKAKEYGYSFLALADNSLGGMVKFFEICEKEKIKPIIGLKTPSLLLYAKNDDGYRNLLKISTIQETTKEVNLDTLQKYNQGLIAITHNIYDNFEKQFLQYQEIFSDFYLGISVQNSIGKKYAKEIYDFGKKNKILVLPLSKTSYLEKHQKIVYDYLKKIDSQTPLEGEYYLKTTEELKNDFSDYKDVFLNIEELIKNVRVNIIKTSVVLPKFITPNNILASKYLYELCSFGLKKRLKDNVLQEDIYIKRLKYELQVINKMQYEDYFLIVWDFIKYAKNINILVGPGRGSSAGSLVAYCLGITNVDPIHYNLIFERFLNPERISMPDIDLDFPDDKRGEIIKYVANKYGIMHVCHIATFGRYQARMAVRDVARVMQLSNNKLEEVIKKTDQSLSLEENLKNNELVKLCEDEEIKQLIKIALAIEGLPKHLSTHAAGIILCQETLTDIIPLTNGMNDIYQSQLEATDLEKLGLLKIDFLGLKNLTMIEKISKMIPNFSIHNISLSDNKTFASLVLADTSGVFQLESQGMRNVLRKLKPKVLEDIIAVLALFRPGPMEQIDEYIARKNGAIFSYLHPHLEPILKSTYGIIVYQEQIMRIASDFAGYSLGEADILRRAVSKKKQEILIEERLRFVEKCINKGYKQLEANSIYDYIVKFANYGFNRNHSVPYAIIAYQMAYLKSNYPLYFMSALLTGVIGSENAIRNYVQESQKKHIDILPPNINCSTLEFEVERRSIRYPLVGIKGVGNSIASKIIEEREKGIFKDFSDFKKRVNPNEKLLYALVFSGALDEFKLSKKEMTEYTDNVFFSKNVDGLIDKKIIEYTENEIAEKEKEVMGFNLIHNPLQKYEKYMKENNILRIDELDESMINQNKRIIGFFKKGKIIRTKTNEEMAFLTFSDSQTENEIVIFPKEYEKLKKTLEYGIIYEVEITLDMRNKQLQLVVQKMELMN